MDFGDKITIIVGEPWDFTSSEGDNIFSGTFINSIVFNSSMISLVKVNHPFILNGSIINYVVLTPRGKINVDIGHIPDDCVSEFEQFGKIKECLQFIMIGSIKEK
jgi:hypothetical protein